LYDEIPVEIWFVIGIGWPSTRIAAFNGVNVNPVVAIARYAPRTVAPAGLCTVSVPPSVLSLATPAMARDTRPRSLIFNWRPADAAGPDWVIDALGVVPGVTGSAAMETPGGRLSTTANAPEITTARP